MEDNPYDFSFSGLKSAVINLIHNEEQRGAAVDVPLLSGALRARVCDILIENTFAAAKALGYKSVAIAGGVSANSELRRRFPAECERYGMKFYCPELKYCGDNAAMVGAQAFYEYQSGHTASASLNAVATMAID